MSIRAQSAPALQEALRDLRNNWHHHATGWRDEARRGFERDHLDPLISACEEAVRGVQELEQVLARIHRDCSDARV
jgi:hypothetical protein